MQSDYYSKASTQKKNIFSTMNVHKESTLSVKMNADLPYHHTHVSQSNVFSEPKCPNQVTIASQPGNPEIHT